MWLENNSNVALEYKSRRNEPMKAILSKYKNIAITSAFALLGLSQAQAQSEYYWGHSDHPYIEYRGFSLGGNFGMTDLWGDLGTKKVLDHYTNNKYWNDPHFMGGLFVRYTYLPGWAFRMGVNYGKVFADDAWNQQYAFESEYRHRDYVNRYYRNLNVRTSIWEANLMTEIAPLRLFSNWEFSRNALRRFQPYLLLGVTGIRFNPMGYLKDYESGYSKWYDLRPLSTEGQGFNVDGMPDYYSRYTWGAIGGVGFKWDVGRMFGLGLEFQLRYLMTDYLDDVSGKYIDPIYFDIQHVNNPGQSEFVHRITDKTWVIAPGTYNAPGTYRGDPNNKDMYSTISVMFYWKVDKQAIPWWRDYR